ncbi:MAG: hypothetical protein IJC48_08400 [Clostridia bacterium]|nr:hypothetical protein [Clostridia bacterium]
MKGTRAVIICLCAFLLLSGINGVFAEEQIPVSSPGEAEEETGGTQGEGEETGGESGETDDADKRPETITLWHMLALVGKEEEYARAESTEELENPHSINADEYTADIKMLAREYEGFEADEIEEFVNGDGYVYEAEIRYKRISFPLTIVYHGPDDGVFELIEPIHLMMEYGAQFEFASPEAEGYEADIKIVSGCMPVGGAEFTVVYSAVSASTPSEPGGDATPSEPSDDATPSEPGGDATPSEPGDDATPSEPGGDATPSEPGDDATPSEPGGDATPSEPDDSGKKPSGFRPSGGRGGMTGAGTVKPGEAATIDHAKGKRDLTAHWGVQPEIKSGETTVLTIGGEKIGIAFYKGGEESAFSAEIFSEEDRVYLGLSSGGRGTWKINGFAIRILRESGIDAIRLLCTDYIAEISTSACASGDDYAYLKSMGVGERRMEYTVSFEGMGDPVKTAYADGETVDVSLEIEFFGREDGS